MSGDPDACLPQPVKDFVFDLHDSSRRSQIASEQSSLYVGTFRDITSKYFAQSAWPSPEAISSECGGDVLFLALYKEMTLRHYHGISRVTVRDRIEGWHVYRTLFDRLLALADDAESNDGNVMPGEGLFILPSWAFDIMHEFVYQFQGFCQFRTTQAANYAAAKASKADGGGMDLGDGGKKISVPSNETIDLLASNRDAWAVETVLFYLHRLVSIASQDKVPSQAHRVLGIFSSVALSRLECLLGDYRAALAALLPLDPSSNVIGTAPPAAGVLPEDMLEEDGARTDHPSEVLNGVFAAKLSMAYHGGVSYLMLRRYKDASKVLGEVCATMQRGFKTGQLRKLPGSEQFSKQYDRMVALLAILVHICPGARVEDSILKTIRDRYGAQLSKIESGEEGYEDLFLFACPKFVNPAVPDYDYSASSSSAGPGGAPSPTLSQDVYKLQVRQFMSEMSQQHTLRKLRSYMKLYTSISVGKLASFNDTDVEEFGSSLLCYKHKMRQLECGKAGSHGGDNGEEDAKNGEDLANEEDNKPLTSASPLEGTYGTAIDIHYYMNDDMIFVDEAEKQRRFENFFMAQIAQSEEIMKDLEGISTRF